MMKRSLTLALTAALSAGTVIATQPAAAQQSPASGGGAQQMRQQVKDINVSDQKMKQFVAVQQQVAEVSRQYMNKVQKQESQSDKQAMSRKAQKEMSQIVEQSPLSIREYNKIAMALSNNPKLQKQYKKFGN